MDTLALLLKHAPNRMPHSNAVFDGVCLKARVDAVRNNWFPGCNPSKKLTPKQMRDFDTFLPYWKSYIAGLKKLRAKRVKARIAKKKTQNLYSAIAFTDSHEKFKNDMAKRVAVLFSEHVPDGKWLVLDDFGRQRSKGLRTVSFLKAAHLAYKNAYVCNPGRSQVESALRAGVNAAQTLCEKALVNEWKDVSFSGAYLDFCSGSAAYVENIVDLAMKSASRRFVMGITITGRDSAGQSIIDRYLDIDQVLVRKYDFVPLGRAQRDSVFFFRAKSVLTVFYVRF